VIGDPLELSSDGVVVEGGECAIDGCGDGDERPVEFAREQPEQPVDRVVFVGYPSTRWAVGVECCRHGCLVHLQRPVTHAVECPFWREIGDVKHRSGDDRPLGLFGNFEPNKAANCLADRRPGLPIW